MSFNPQSYSVSQPLARRGIMTQVYAWMTAGLLTTGAVSALVASSSAFISLIYGTPLYLVLFLIELGMVWYLSARVGTMSVTRATTMFLLYSVLNGLTLAAIFLIYTESSIASTFFITAGMFGGMSAVGYVIKRDLSMIGNILIMALIGVILASIVNLFMQSTALFWVLTYVGILIFVGLTAWDTQRIKRMSQSVRTDDDAHRVAIYGALILYLDFINLFIRLLRIFGSRR